MVRDFYDKPFFYWYYIVKYKSNKYWEYLVKMKLYRLLTSIICNWHYAKSTLFIDESKKSIIDIFGLNKNEFKILKEFDGALDLLLILQRSKNYNINFSIDEIRLIWKYDKIDINLMEFCKDISVIKLAGFLEKENDVLRLFDNFRKT